MQGYADGAGVLTDTIKRLYAEPLSMAEPLSIVLSGNYKERRDDQERKRRRTSMSLYQRGDIWWVKLYRDGVPTYKSTKTADKQEARRIHDIWAGEIAQGSFLPRADQKRYEELVE